MRPQIVFDPSYARSDFLPLSNGNYNLGSTALAWNNSYINNLRSGTGSGLTLRATSANIAMYTSGLNRWEVDTSGRFTQDVTNGGDIVFNKTDSLLRFGTSDGSDNKTMYLCGGGSYGGSRGGTIRLDGNESANAGSVTIESGVTTGSRIYFKTNNLDIWRMSIGGTFEQNATNGSDIVFNVTASGIRMGTSDGADNKELVLAGGGAMEAVGQCNRGAKLVLAGLEHATRPGESYLEANYIKLRAFNSGYVITQTDNLLFRNAAGNNVWTIVSGVLAQDGTNGSDLVFNASTGIIRQGTSDASDNKVLVVAGGGGISTSRGATVSVYGNESAGGGGAIALTGGAVSTGYINFDLSHASATVRIRNSSGGELWAFNNSGHLAQDTTDGGLLIFNKANTTMRFNGAMGNSTKVVGTDAPADWVEINIAGTTYYLPAYAA